MRTWKCRSLLAGLLLAVLLLTACASSAAKAAKKIELGQKYLTEMNYTEAVASFTEAIKLEPDNIQAYIGRAEAYMALGKYDKALEDYQFVSGKTEEMPYTRALSYIGQAEVYERTDKPEKALSDYELAKALLNASDAGKAEDVSEEDVGVKLVQVLYAHAALCESIKSYDKTLDDYDELLELGEKVEKKRDELLSQLGDSIDEENGLPGTEEPETGKTAQEPDTEESGAESTIEKLTEEPTPEQEASSASESQPTSEKTKLEEAVSSSEQLKEEAASSHQEKNNWVNYTEETDIVEGHNILNIRYGIGECTIIVQRNLSDADREFEEKTIYRLSAPLQSFYRDEKGYGGHSIFYVPEGTTVTMAYSYRDSNFGPTPISYDPAYFNWVETDRIIPNMVGLDYHVIEEKSMTVQKDTIYQLVIWGNEDGWIDESSGAVFCTE